jgi:uncharacterized protein (DUF3820 family)
LFLVLFFINNGTNQKQLIKLAHTKMPLVNMKEGISLTCQNTTWYGIVIKDSQKELGQQLQLIYELKLNGLEELIRNIKKDPKPL